jgi:hypothetical protein
MNFVVVSKDIEVVKAAREGFHPSDVCQVFEDWRPALQACASADMLFVDLIATLVEPNRIAGYEIFANAKMTDPVCTKVPLVIIGPEPNYDLDYMVGWPDFAFGHIQRPVSFKHFRRASTWV